MLYLIHCTSNTVLYTVYDVKCYFEVPSEAQNFRPVSRGLASASYQKGQRLTAEEIGPLSG